MRVPKGSLAAVLVLTVALFIEGAVFGQSLATRDLMILSLQEDNTAGIQQALDAGFPVNQELDGSGATALVWARSPQAVGILLSRGAAAGLVTKTGETPLSASSSRGDLKSVDLLLQAGADPRASGPRSCGPLCEAVQGSHLEVAKRLLDSGAQVDQADCWNRRALTIAAAGGLSAAVGFLLDHGANADQYDTAQGDTIVIHAARAINGTESLKLLIEKGANVSWPNPLSCETALHRAVERQGDDATRLLLGAGADPNTVSHKQLTPLDVAEQQGNAGMAALLEGAGAKHGADVTQAHDCIESAGLEDAHRAWLAARGLHCPPWNSSIPAGGR